MSRFSICRWISADDKTELYRFMEAHRGDIARDLDGDPVFLAQNIERRPESCAAEAADAGDAE